MAVAKFKLDCVAAYWLPARDENSWIGCLVGAPMELASEIAFSNILGTRRAGTKVLHFVKVFTSVGPADSYFIADQLDVLRGQHC